jgi:hypothetical protein
MARLPAELAPGCPACAAPYPEVRVLSTRFRKTDGAVRRRRECRGCGHRWTTLEGGADRIRRGAAAVATVRRLRARESEARLGAAAWRRLEELAAAGRAVWVEHDPGRARSDRWQCSVSDAAAPAAGATCHAALTAALERLPAPRTGRRSA